MVYTVDRRLVHHDEAIILFGEQPGWHWTLRI